MSAASPAETAALAAEGHAGPSPALLPEKPPTAGCCCAGGFSVPSAVAICCFAYVGVLARLGLTEFSGWWAAQQSLAGCTLLGSFGHGFFLPNIVGCFLMGAAKRMAAQTHGRHALLYTGFTTGLCGCLTTFATWNQAASVQLIRGNVSEALVLLVLQHVVSLSALQLGMHVGGALGRKGTPDVADSRRRGAALESLARHAKAAATHGQRAESLAEQLGVEVALASATPATTRRKRAAIVDADAASAFSSTALATAKQERAQDTIAAATGLRLWGAVVLVLTAGVWLFIALADAHSAAQYWGLSIAFAPVGALGRYSLSLLNSTRPSSSSTGGSFPVGTFAANLLGSCLSAICACFAVEAALADVTGNLPLLSNNDVDDHDDFDRPRR